MEDEFLALPVPGVLKVASNSVNSVGLENFPLQFKAVSIFLGSEKTSVVRLPSLPFLT